jgi:hypothetical protein
VRSDRGRHFSAAELWGFYETEAQRVPDKPMRINGRRVVPDFRWPDQRLIVEA